MIFADIAYWLTYLLPFIFVLGVVVFVHELGHFLVARYFDVSVKAFSIGFGPEIAGFYDRHGTRWRISWIPLGGYVMFEGDENVASMPGHELGAIPEDKRAGILHYKPVGQRAAVLAAGPIANFLLAIVIMTFWFMLVGKAVTEPRVAGVSKDSAAEEAGFKPDDLVLKIDGQEIYSFEELQRIIALSANTPLNVLVERDGKHLLLKAAPRLVEREDHSRVGRLGIYASPPRVVKVEPGSAAEKAGIKAGDDVLQINSGDVESFADIQEAAAENPGKPLELIVSRDGRQLTLPVTPEAQDREINGEVVKVGVLGIQMERKGRVYERLYPPQAFLMALSETWFGIKLPVIFIQKLLTGEASGKEVRGILGIAQLSHDVAQANPWNIFQLLAFISIQIGLLNLFPIPILDGGHLLFYGIEAIRGRPLSERAMEISFRIGFALVIMLMLFATRNDVIHLLRMFRHTE